MTSVVLSTLLAALAMAQGAPPPAAARNAAPAPASAPLVAPLRDGESQKLQALVIAVEGRAEWRAAGSTTFKVAAVNDLLDAGCEIRTGLRSMLTLRVGKNATLLVDRSSRIELPLIVQDGAVLRTRAAVWRGKCDFKVEAVGVTSDFQVLTPSATLAVRGTGFSVDWGAFAGLQVKGVDTNRIHAIEVHWLETRRTVLLSGDAESSSAWIDPLDQALLHTVFPPPWPDRNADAGGNPITMPPPLLHDIHQQQQIQHGGSDIGKPLDQGQKGFRGPPPNGG
jgi:hypothetical protein